MSFILDALRKSENERQRLGATSIAEFPVGRSSRQPWWVIALAALLLANLALLLAVMLRRPAVQQTTSTSDAAVAIQVAKPTASSTSQAATEPARTATDATLNSSLAAAAMPAPQVEYDTVDRSVLDAASAVPDGPRLVRPRNDTGELSNDARLMLGSPPPSLAELHLDMHVYAPRASDRFAFINGRKYSEGQTLAEGPRIEEITAGGVTLSMDGAQWQLNKP